MQTDYQTIHCLGHLHRWPTGRTGVAAAFDAAAEDGDVNAIVVTGTGANFMAGADITEIKDAVEVDPLFEKVLAFDELYNRIENSPKAVVAAINGEGHPRAPEPDPRRGCARQRGGAKAPVVCAGRRASRRFRNIGGDRGADRERRISRQHVLRWAPDGRRHATGPPVPGFRYRRAVMRAAPSQPEVEVSI